MPAILIALGEMVVGYLASWIVQFMISAGVGVVTMTGLSTGLAWLKSQALNGAQGMGATAVGVLGLLRVGEIISILFSALAAKLVYKGVQAAAGGTKKTVVKK